MFNIKRLLTLVLSFFTVAVFASDTPQISQQDLLAALKVPNNNIVILDVRSEDEFNHGHIHGAIHFSHDTITANLIQLAKYKNNKVVVYCRSGRRAGIAEHIMAENGFNDLHHLTGDMNGWLEAKLPVVSNEHSH